MLEASTTDPSEILAPLMERTRLLHNCQARELDLVDHVKKVIYDS